MTSVTTNAIIATVVIAYTNDGVNAQIKDGSRLAIFGESLESYNCYSSTV